MDRRLVLGALGALAGCREHPNQPAVADARRAPGKPAPSPFNDEFWATWGDGQAELCGYELWMPRYGKVRKGTAVSIFVTEPFSKAQRVKSERASATGSFPVMKLNLIRDYQTGIYDYNDMLSSFVALEPVNGLPAGAATKVSFSCQEWCGHVYSQLLFSRNQVTNIRHSYFENEADGQQVLDWEPGVIAADVLMHWARGMAYPQVRPGSPQSVNLLTSLEEQRARHVDLKVQAAVLSLGAPISKASRVGRVAVQTCIVRSADGLTRSYEVEAAPPRRIIQWESSTGERAELLGSIRLKYWELNGPGGRGGFGRDWAVTPFPADDVIRVTEDGSTPLNLPTLRHLADA